MQHPEHLAQFASLFDRRDINRFISAPWLISAFDAPVWRYSFGYKVVQELDWSVQLYDGSFLIDPKNSRLLKALRCWLIASTQNAENHRHTNSMGAQAADFRRTITLIDHMLQRGADLDLCTHGLSMLTYDDMTDILEQVGSSSYIAVSTYDWNRNLTAFCKSLVKISDPAEIQQTLKDHAYLSVITPIQLEDNELDISLEDIPAVRAALFIHKLYHQIPTGGLNVNSARISAQIYGNTLAGKKRLKPMHRILGYVQYDDRFTRELDGVPVTTKNRDRMTRRDLVLYRTCFTTLQKLSRFDLSIPSSDDLLSIARYNVTGSKMGRFKNVPTDIIFKTIRNAIEFHIDYGQHILKSYINLAKHAVKHQVSLTSIPDETVITLIEPEIAELGVRKLGISTRSPGKAPSAERKQKKDFYFRRLRNNEGLLELLAVYFASVQIVVGGTMAKRGVELRGLIPGTCLSEDMKWLIAPIAKSTRGRKGLRSNNARPIDPLAAEMIQGIVKFQDGLLAIGYIEKTLPLFSSPGLLGVTSLIPCDVYLYYKNIDLFCDYFQVDVDDNGRRYYLRQHQLRRFFALVFLNSGYGASIELLQWMFGHSDPEHIWNYITEELPGKELRNTLAQALSERMASGKASEYTDIIDLIEDHFGTRSVSVMDTEQLSGWLDFLMESGELKLEPVFLENDSGYRVELLTIVRKKYELE